MSENNKEKIQNGRIAEFINALQSEIETIKQTSLSSIVISNGHQLEKLGEGFSYRFSVEYRGTIPADTPCSIVIEQNKYDATVINYEELFITLYCKNDLGNFIGKAQLENGSTFLMEKMIQRIEQNAEKDNPAGLRMFGENPFIEISTQPMYCSDNLNEQQYNAVESAIHGNITYIWGPPGTGKTKVISYIINALYTQNRSVLLVSHTNTAVDGALKQLCRQLKKQNTYNDIANFPVLRLGSSISPQLALEYPEVILDHHVTVLSAELVDQRKKLETKQESCHAQLTISKHDKKLFEWMESFQINKDTLYAYEADRKRTLSDLENMEEKLLTVLPKIEILTNKLENYKPYFSLNEKLNIADTNYSQLLQSRNALYNCKQNLLNQLKQKENQLVLHTRYNQLRKELQNHLDYITQQNRINKITDQISDININQTNLSERKKALDCMLTKSKNQSTFRRVFSGIDSPQKIQIQLDSLNMQFLNLNTDLSVKQQLLQQYQDEYITTLTIISECNSIELVSSPETLTKEIWQLNQAINTNHANSNHIDDDIVEHEKNINYLKKQIASLCLESDCNPLDVKNLFEKECIVRDSIKKEIESYKLNISQLESHLVSEVEPYNSLFDKSITALNFDDALSDMNQEYCSLLQKFCNITAELINKNIKDLDTNLNEILTQIRDINTKIHELADQVIDSIPIIGTTLSKSYLEDKIQARSFDTVILDEASMAPIPALWCASCLAEKNIIIVGDFKQLAPIVISDDEMAQKWLGRDIFDHSGMEKLWKQKKAPPHFIQLNLQYRMEQDIADIASKLYYKGQLKTAISPQRDAEKQEFANWYGGTTQKSSINIIDTKELHAWVTGIAQGKKKTRLNHLSACLCVDLAFSLVAKLIEDGQINQTKLIIISPYRAHTKRIQQLINHECIIKKIDPDNFNLVKPGTIHSFQGSEADIVIFDLVVDEPHWNNNLFINAEDANNGLRKMFNVAVTRAKFKLFIVGNINYCRKRAKENALGEFLEVLIDSKKTPILDAKKLFPKLSYVHINPSINDVNLEGKRLICTQENYYDYLTKDLLTAQHQAIIYSPFISQDRLSQILPILQTAIYHGVKIYIVTKAIEEHSAKAQEHYQQCKKIITENGINIIHKKRMHEKLVFIDDSILWTGSLNTLSFSNTQEIMERRQDKTVLEEYAIQLNIENLIEVSDNQYQQKCPVCNNEIIAAESDAGGIYWTCSSCDYSRNADEPYPIDGEIMCNKCEAHVEFIMVNQPRWICTKHKNHYRKVRRSDLMLPKMLSKIPISQRLMVVNILASTTSKKTDIERNILANSTIRQFSDKGQLIAGFESIKEASDNVNISIRCISKVLNGHQYTAGGFQWKGYSSGTAAVDIDPILLSKHTSK